MLEEVWLKADDHEASSRNCCLFVNLDDWLIINFPLMYFTFFLSSSFPFFLLFFFVCLFVCSFFLSLMEKGMPDMLARALGV